MQFWSIITIKLNWDWNTLIEQSPTVIEQSAQNISLLIILVTKDLANENVFKEVPQLYV